MKVDFFGGDGQSIIAYYLDILDDAAPYGFLMNFHGATLPRGWQRTYPHLMTMESVRGLEFVTFEQRNADQEPTHAAMLPFTRNVFDPMDFTPMVLDRISNIERRTTAASSWRCPCCSPPASSTTRKFPQGMAKVPEYVREISSKACRLSGMTRNFIDGYPGKFVVLARQGKAVGMSPGSTAKIPSAS